MSAGWFIAGTDTGVGKTSIARALLLALNARGCRTAAMKPVASGSVVTDGGLRNADAECLRDACNLPLAYDVVNPYAFGPPIAPHLAAQQAQRQISIPVVVETYRAIVAKQPNYIVVEGVGGWRVPLDDTQTTVEMAAALGLPVILVVGLRLGCLNHALLTVRDIAHSGLRLAGWVANAMAEEMPMAAENIATLCARIPAPLLATIPSMGGDIDDWLFPLDILLQEAHA